MQEILFLLLFVQVAHSFSASDLLGGVEKLSRSINIPANIVSLLKLGNDGCAEITDFNSSLTGEILHLAGEFSDNKTENHLLKLSFESENGLTPLSITSRMHSFWKNQVSLAAIYEVKFLNGIVMNDTLPSPLKDSNQFDIRIRFLEKQIQIFFNQGEIGTYPKPDSLAKIKKITFCSKYTKELKLFRFEGQTFTNPFTGDFNFGVGNRLEISGLPIPNVFDEAKMQKLLIENEKFEDTRLERKNKNPDVKIDLEDFLKDLKNGRVKRQAVRQARSPQDFLDIFKKPIKWYGHPEGIKEFDSFLGESLLLSFDYQGFVPFEHSFLFDTAGYLVGGMLPSNSYRYKGETKTHSSCYKCRWYCESCCESCDYFHQQSRGESTRKQFMEDIKSVDRNKPLSERFDVTFLSKENEKVFQKKLKKMESFRFGDGKSLICLFSTPKTNCGSSSMESFLIASNMDHKQKIKLPRFELMVIWKFIKCR
ncbi:unnamed protein product, partial [Mesorhabditis belari]|uniref:Uncharacterized protein n=1 Tax=Mesorhabditis belari TaxID=2138241 RepID=A0AAF3J4B1_9BILA